MLMNVRQDAKREMIVLLLLTVNTLRKRSREADEVTAAGGGHNLHDPEAPRGHDMRPPLPPHPPHTTHHCALP
ncbi:hypothetical protein E2C01_058189 [Portunus trituberculatus]|uniref:Uncharacterized protein n=1 Tax=Portunus trituberculatus TaxID=210409 RepID=A0A5B7GVR1_PORTR|nr:hypothetical protein [Portunus trituberculatus]